MGNVVYLGIEKMKRFNESDWKAILAEAESEKQQKEVELRKKLIESDIKTINDPSKGKYLFCGIPHTDDQESIYVWADNEHDARLYAIEYNDFWLMEHVIDTDGNIDMF